MMDSITRKGFLCFCVLAIGSASALGQRVFVVPEGQTPTLGQTYTIDAKGGEELRLEVWVENLPAGEKLKEWNVVMPCSASGGVAGSIDYPVATERIRPFVDVDHPFYVFAGLPPNGVFSSVGSCPTGMLPSFPSVFQSVYLGTGVPVTTPKYMATFTYIVTNDAEGTFTIAAAPATICGKFGTWLRKDEQGLVCFQNVQFDPITINVRLGRCCIVDQSCPQVCQEEVLQRACEDQGGRFTPDVSCAADCPPHCQLHGDVFPPSPLRGNCVVDIDDVVYMLAAFTDIDPCTNFPDTDLFPCEGPCSTVDIDDIVSVLGAFAETYDCPHPCPP